MMNGMTNCGWVMMLGAGVIYGVLLFVGAAAVKYLFFVNKESTGTK